MAAPRLARRLALPIVGVLALAAPAAASAVCAGESVAATDPAAPAATLCLLNAERAAQGLAPLVGSASLDAAANTHAADMTARRYFAHESPEGATLQDRVAAAGWLPERGAWTIGEDIAWGSGALGTPVRIVAAWMASPGHRANVLQPAFSEVGIGIAVGAPRSGVPGTAGTYVADFGGKDAPSGPAAAATTAPAPSTADATPARRSKACTRATRRAKTARSAKARRAAARIARRCGR